MPGEARERLREVGNLGDEAPGIGDHVRDGLREARRGANGILHDVGDDLDRAAHCVYNVTQPSHVAPPRSLC